MAQVRVFKVRSHLVPGRLFGISVNPSVSTVRSACQKRNLINEGDCLSMEDGTPVDDEVLLSDSLWAPNNKLVVGPPPPLSKYDDILATITSSVEELKLCAEEDVEAVKRAFNAHRSQSLSKNMALCDPFQFVTSTEARETRKEDPNWFAGMAEKFQTKTDVMRSRARGRIYNYLSDARKYMKTKCNDEKVKAIMKKVINTDFVAALEAHDRFGGLFDRADEKNRLCDSKGYFTCPGQYSKKRCEYQHVINPYASLVMRLEFSNWHFDHVIEKGRSVLPALKEAATLVLASEGTKKVDCNYYFGLLFTPKNLRLVPKACNELSAHTDQVAVIAVESA